MILSTTDFLGEFSTAGKMRRIRNPEWSANSQNCGPRRQAQTARATKRLNKQRRQYQCDRGEKLDQDVQARTRRVFERIA